LDPKNGVLHDYLTKKSSENMVVISKKPISFSSKEIITEYKTISIENNISLLEIHLITGKTHQIRAHLNFIGHPLIGEKKYSSVDERNKKFQDLISYKLIFNLKKHNGILEYLSKKTIKI
jgi:23S rRNA pseudouridine955/2504/2580 synthase